MGILIIDGQLGGEIQNEETLLVASTRGSGAKSRLRDAIILGAWTGGLPIWKEPGRKLPTADTNVEQAVGQIAQA